MALRRRDAYEDQGARLSILAGVTAPKPDTLTQTAQSWTKETTCKRDGPYVLPAHAPLVPDQLDMPVALAGRGTRGRARHRGRAWRDDHGHGRVGLVLGDGAVDGLAVVCPVRDHRAKGTGDLLEQWTHLGGVAFLVARQFAGEDLAGCWDRRPNGVCASSAGHVRRASRPATLPRHRPSARSRRSPRAPAHSPWPAPAPWRAPGLGCAAKTLCDRVRRSPGRARP